MIGVADVRAMHEILAARGANIVRGLETHPWGGTDFYVTDPDDYIVCFFEVSD